MATTNPLLQQIDAIAKEKGVEPEIIILAVQDALEAAARKRYKSEALRARFNTESGQLELYAVKKIVTDVTDAATQISLSEAQGLYGDEAEVDMEIEFPHDVPEDLGRIARRRDAAKQVIFQRSGRPSTRTSSREYSQPVGEVAERHRQAVPERRHHHPRTNAHRMPAAAQRTVARRELLPGDRGPAVIGINRSGEGPQVCSRARIPPC